MTPALAALLKTLRTYLRQSGFRGVMLTRAELEMLVTAIEPGALPKEQRRVEI